MLVCRMYETVTAVAPPVTYVLLRVEMFGDVLPAQCAGQIRETDYIHNI